MNRDALIVLKNLFNRLCAGLLSRAIFSWQSEPKLLLTVPNRLLQRWIERDTFNKECIRKMQIQNQSSKAGTHDGSNYKPVVNSKCSTVIIIESLPNSGIQESCMEG